MRVLYFNHTAIVSGAERSLLDLIAGLPDGEVEPVVACPQGPLSERVRLAAVPHVTVPGTTGSLKLHVTRTPWALVEMLRSAGTLRRAVHGCDAQLVHANSVRSGLIAIVAFQLGGPPVVVHVRDVLPRSRVADLVRWVIARSAAAILANSEHTAGPLRRARPRGRIEVLHNPLDLQRFDPSGMDRRSARARLGISESAPLLAVVGQITPWKNQATAVSALARIRGQRPDARLLLVGESKFVHRATRLDNQGYERAVRALAARLEVSDAVAFLGEREDVPEILAALDMLLVPSWEEPFGRSVIEAMAMGVPVLATNVGGPAEIIADGREGRLLAPDGAETWAAAVAELLDDPVRCATMGRVARVSARRFDRTRHALAVLRVYNDVLSRHHGRRLRQPRPLRRWRARTSSRVARRLGAS